MRSSGRIIFLLILVLGAAVRFYGLGQESYWQDEFLSLKDSSGQMRRLESLPTDQLVRDLPHLTRLDPSTPWWRLWGPVDCEIQPPLYYVLLHFWREGFGDSELAVRSFSALGSMVGLFFFYKALRLQGLAATALWGTALLAVASAQIHAAQNARDYTLWMALAMGAAYTLLLIEHRGFSWQRGLALGLCTLAMLLTHYFAAFSVVSLGIYALIRLRGRARHTTVSVLFGAGILFLILWGKELHNQDHGGVAWLMDRGQHPLLETFVRIVQLPLRSISAIGDNLPASGIFFLAIVVGCWLARKDRRVLFWIVWAVPLILCVVGIDVIHRMRALDVSRYTFVGTAAFCALVPMLSQHLFRRRWALATVAIFLTALASVPWAYPRATEWRELAAMFRAGVHKGDVVVYTGGNWNRWEPYILYLGIDHYAPDLASDFVLLRDWRAPIMRQLPVKGKSMWMVCYDLDLPQEAIVPNGRVVQQTVLPNVGRVSQMVRR